jgi:ribosomal-protein-alanine N-acetyltransferase
MSAEAYKGQGFMSEAIPPIIAFGFKEMGLNRIEAFIHPENIPSIRLVERMGFQQEGCLHEHYCKEGVPCDSLIYGLLLKDYAGRRQG